MDRLNIGAGRASIDGWTNVDLEPFDGVDVVLDVRDGLPFEDVRYIHAEHFIEHLTHDEGVRFLAECRRALVADGVLRLSTPNLDWVLATLHRPSSPDPIRDCFGLNKAFRAWGHQFLYNAETLRAALFDAGFATVTSHQYGESDNEDLRRLERHERDLDTPELPHVIILEGTGRKPPTRLLEQSSEDYDWAMRP